MQFRVKITLVIIAMLFDLQYTPHQSAVTNAALEKITGINQRQLQHYSSGLKKPRQPQLKKMEERHHHLTSELKALELILIQIIR